jgi:hypothetical protein
MLTGGLGTPPTVTTTGWFPVGTEAGTSIFTWPYPSDVLPAKTTKTGTPPTVTESGKAGAEKLGSETDPIPVT